MVAVIHRKSKQNPGRVYAQVTSVVKLPKGMGCPKSSLDRINYEITDGEGGDFAKLPEWIQEKVMNSEEWNAQPDGDGSNEEDYDEPPTGSPDPDDAEEPDEPEPPRPPAKKKPVRKGPPPEPEDEDDIPF
jgi:hypothetical protein